jgi:hypothetical protein
MNKTKKLKLTEHFARFGKRRMHARFYSGNLRARVV